ncbi:MAG: hypothetical protein QOD63_1594, partial [Actinomycetota bacterium]|nr:hypothetical protein [Actinomycetota bacterium]
MGTRTKPAPPAHQVPGSSVTPTEADRQALVALHRRPWLISAALVALPVVFSVVMGLYQDHRWEPLLSTGVRWPAEVVDTTSYARATGYLRVAFALPDGRLVEASVPVSNPNAHPVGSTEVVVYDHLDPGRVRMLYGWAPPYTLRPPFLAIFGFLSLWFLWHAWRWPRRLWSLANGPECRRMAALIVDGPRRGPTPWALLFEQEALPGSRPRLAVPVADGAGLERGPTEVGVRGRPSRQGIVVLRGPNGLIWSVGRVRRPSRALRHAATVDIAARVWAPPDVVEGTAGAGVHDAGTGPASPRPLMTLPPGLFDAKPPRR